MSPRTHYGTLGGRLVRFLTGCGKEKNPLPPMRIEPWIIEHALSCHMVPTLPTFVHQITDTEGLTLSWPAGHLCPTYKESFQVHWDNSISLFLHAATYLEVSLFRWTSRNAFPRETAVYKWYCMQCCFWYYSRVSLPAGIEAKRIIPEAALHTVPFVHGCFMGKCIPTGSTE
jgi:hypothetical protein